MRINCQPVSISARTMDPWILYFAVLIHVGTCALSVTSSTVLEEPSHPTGRQYDIEIPAKGIAKDEQHEVNLQGGDKLQIVDKTKSATVQPAEFSSAAYAYDRSQGSCDMNNKLIYKNAFSLAPSNYTFWEIKNSPPKNVNDPTYTFSTPPADQLKGSVSFCFEFEVNEGEGTSIKPTPGISSFRRHNSSKQLITPNRTQQASHYREAGHGGTPAIHSVVTQGPTKRKIVFIVHSGGSSFLLSGAVIISIMGSWLYGHA